MTCSKNSCYLTEEPPSRQPGQFGLAQFGVFPTQTRQNPLEGEVVQGAPGRHAIRGAHAQVDLELLVRHGGDISARR